MIVPVKLVEQFEMFRSKFKQEMEDANRCNPHEQSRCVYCWLQASTNDPVQVQMLGQIVSFSEVFMQMYPGTQKRGSCEQCGGNMPFGRDSSGRERICKYSCLF